MAEAVEIAASVPTALASAPGAASDPGDGPDPIGPAPAANNNNGEGSSEGVTAPPSYAQVVAGDHKVQTQD